MKNELRSQKAIKNTIAGIGSEIVLIVSGLIIPRFILSRFGSSYNGITSSITQFISCISLMKAGIGGVTRAALYKPLAESDNEKISEIFVQTERFMRRIALFFVIFILLFATIYPILVPDFPWIFTFSLVVIIGLSTFAQYYFGLTYQMLISADQRSYIVSVINIFTNILNTFIAAILINAGCGIHMVKLGSAIAFTLNPILISIYGQRRYKINKKVTVKTDLLKQRWSATWHAVADFVNTNTDVMVLTVFSNIKEISVYTVYYFVIKGIRTVITIFINGFDAAFGNMYAKKEFDLMNKNMGIFENVVFSATTIVYATTLVMLVPYTLLYTKGVLDVDYNRPIFSAIITLAGAISCYRIPYQAIVTAVGHYRQTRNGAIAEAVLNIGISILFVIKLGLIGVAIGTICAAIFRSVQYALYLSHNIMNRDIKYFISHVVVSLLIMAVTYFIMNWLPMDTSTWGLWIIKSIFCVALSGVLTLCTNFLFYRESTLLMIKKLKHRF